MPRGLGKSSPAQKLFSDLISTFDAVPERWKPIPDTARRDTPRRRALAALARQAFVETRRDGETLYIRLTQKGVQQALRQTVIEKTALLPKGEYVYVSFDLPESVRALRDAFRLILKDARFRMIHQSLWYTTRDVGTELAQLVEELEATKYIHVFQGRWLTRVVSA